MAAMTYQFEDVVALVKREAKSEATPEEVAWLSHPENVTVWKEALATALADVCDQFALKKERVDRAREDYSKGVTEIVAYQSELELYEAWKKKASRYRLGLETRLREVKSKERTRNIMATDASRTVIQLMTAIEKHKAMTLANTQEPTLYDVELWDSVSGVVAS